MKARINIKQITYNLPLILVCIYTFTRGGAALMVSTAIWTIVIGFMLICSLFNLSRRSKTNAKYESILVVSMIIIMIIWNNQDFANGVWFLDYIMIVFFVFLLSAMRTDYWVDTAYNMMMIMGLFHMFWTVVCYLSPAVFQRVVYPIVRSITLYDLSAMYNKGYIMGFNYTNSQDAIYLSMGIITFLCSTMFSQNKKRRFKITNFTLIVLLIVSLLLTGKRGPIIWVFMAFLMTYYVYNSNKKLSRSFKIAALIGIIVTFVYVGSFFIPELTNFIDRFKEQIAAGDITTHRFELWGMGWLGFLRNPIIGNGWFWFKYNNIFGRNYHVHNCFLQWLCELGIIGSLPFFAFAFSVYVKNFRLIKKIRLGAVSVSNVQMRNLAFSLMYQTYFLIYCFAGTTFYEPETLLPWIFSCAIVIYYWRSIYLPSRNQLIEESSV